MKRNPFHGDTLKTWTPDTIAIAEAILPHLVRFAQLGRTTTYKELGERVGRHQRAMRWPLGFIRDEILVPRSLPRLNAIVVSAATGLPGESFLEGGTAHLSPDEYKQKFDRFCKSSFNYLAWDTVLKSLGIRPLPQPSQASDAGSPGKSNSGGGQGYEEDPKVRRLLELYAMRIATEWYESKKLKVEDVSTKQSFDLFCSNGPASFRVEVKGTTSDARTVRLTAGEARSAQEPGIRTDLAIVSGIVVHRVGPEPRLEGGKLRTIQSWIPRGEDMRATEYEYAVPK